MRISYEFLLNKGVKLHIGSFFESSLYQNGKYINKSFGSDNFHVETFLEKSNRISAVGRNCTIQIPIEELPTKVQVPKPSQLTLSSLDNLEILCRTNIFLTKDCLCKHINLSVNLDENKLLIPLIKHNNEITFIEKGRYIINLSNILITIVNKVIF
ncbi:hypothetical protein [Anaerobranca gottschalkii]|uniref:Uncharacterized protein n=1 Tax=Anaerobranca gottschalkii DSM 13577 TaxID=1120990 RepID=A0A1H9Y0L5_9FIRM|nr:hypothetical protein [Anaerobranca gottschalkii]SES62170.1 hypothetical protein SAMN03080614_100120 [Anaerobranca gottschalkii DSM 13577]